MKTVCPHCQARIEVDDASQSRTVRCSTCTREFTAEPLLEALKFKSPTIFSLVNVIGVLICIAVVFVVIGGIMMGRGMVALVGLSLLINAILVFAFAQMGTDIAAIHHHAEVLQELLREKCAPEPAAEPAAGPKPAAKPKAPAKPKAAAKAKPAAADSGETES